MVPIISRINPIHTFLPYFCYPPIYAEVFRVMSSFQVFRLKILYTLLIFSIHATCPISSPWFHQPNKYYIFNYLFTLPYSGLICILMFVTWSIQSPWLIPLVTFKILCRASFCTFLHISFRQSSSYLSSPLPSRENVNMEEGNRYSSYYKCVW
jgi:hypothetical protein